MVGVSSDHSFWPRLGPAAGARCALHESWAAVAASVTTGPALACWKYMLRVRAWSRAAARSDAYSSATALPVSNFCTPRACQMGAGEGSAALLPPPLTLTAGVPHAEGAGAGSAAADLTTCAQPREEPPTVTNVVSAVLLLPPPPPLLLLQSDGKSCSPNAGSRSFCSCCCMHAAAGGAAGPASSASRLNSALIVASGSLPCCSNS